MKLKTLRDFDFRGRCVLLRSDLNSDVVGARVLKGPRIKEALKTIDYLRKRGAQVVVLAHQGNPGKKNFLGLEQHARLLGRKVRFVDDVVGRRAVRAILDLKDGDVILLDNVRKVKDEFEPKRRGNLFEKNILPLIDIYVNDAFSVSHRNHASIVSFAKKRDSCVGLLFEKEIEALEKVHMKKCLYVLGGAKAESNIKLLGRGNKVIACGLFGQACLAARGFDFGYQNNFLRKAILVGSGKSVVGSGKYDLFLKKLKGKLKSVEMPVDFAVLSDKKRREFDLDDFPLDFEVEDIGSKSIRKFVKMIEEADSVYVKGPAGWAENPKFRRGTFEILKAVGKCKGFSLVGGGQLSEAIMKMPREYLGKFDHVSLSGGATLAFVAGEKLVGLRVLGYY